MKKDKSLVKLTVFLVLLAIVLGALCLCSVWEKRLPNAVSTNTFTPKTETRNVPILMYHSILPEGSTQGEYTVTPSQLESDLKYLQQYGYQAVSLDNVISFCEGSGDLPEKPVVLTFDDGQLNNLVYALPLLEKYDLCAAFSIVGILAEGANEDAAPSPSYSYMAYDDIRELLSSGRAESVNHSYDLHKLGERRGALQLSTESYTDYRRMMLNDTSYMQKLFKREFGVVPTVYAYPYGLVCPAAREVIRMLGFKASLGCEEKPNHLTKGSSNGLFELNRYNRSGNVTTEDFMKKALSE